MLGRDEHSCRLKSEEQYGQLKRESSNRAWKGWTMRWQSSQLSPVSYGTGEVAIW
jgi:hypothetical protein